MIKGLTLLAALAAMVVSCQSPIDIDTNRIMLPDRIVKDTGIIDPFVNATKDTIVATIGSVIQTKVKFGYLVERPIFHNGPVDSVFYILMQATSDAPESPGSQRLSIRLDAIRDTGVYQINSTFSVPKKIDRTAPPQYSALYEQRSAGFSSAFRTGLKDDVGEGNGEVHIVKIDRERKIVIGTFRFAGYCTELDSTEHISEGIFRLDLNPHP